MADNKLQIRNPFSENCAGVAPDFKPPSTEAGDNWMAVTYLRRLEGMFLLEHASSGNIEAGDIDSVLSELSRQIHSEAGTLPWPKRVEIPDAELKALQSALKRAGATALAILQQPEKPEHQAEKARALEAAARAGYIDINSPTAPRRR